MFRGCSYITEFDFSNFDTSEVTTMWCMFQGMTSLTSLDLSNFNTSNFKNMAGMFQSCKSLTSLNLSNFDTSEVTQINVMFYNCQSLTSLNLSNFDISKVSKITNLFAESINLEYINIKNFTENHLSDDFNDYQNIFLKIPDNVVICIDPNNIGLKLSSQVSNLTCYYIDCSNNWKKRQKKISTNNNTCIKNCNESSEYIFEYNGKCYDSCPNEFFNDNNIYKCKCELVKCLLCPPVALKNHLCTKCNYDYYPKENDSSNIGEYINCYKDPEGYYLDNEDQIYKSCYYTCETCEIKGNNITHNCLKCKEIFPFGIIMNNYNNCYENYSYYSDSQQIESRPLNNTNIINYSMLQTSENHKYTNQIFISDTIYNFSKYSSQNSIINQYSDNSEKNVIKVASSKNSEYSDSYLIASSIHDIYKYSEIIKESYLLINNENITQKIIKTSSQKQVVYECKKNEINNNCNFLNIDNNTEILDIIKNNIESLFHNNNKNSQIIQGENDIIFQITNSKNELELLNSDNINNQNLSILDLGLCETKLKKEYHIKENDSLIYLKQENKNSKSSENKVEYEIFEPYNFTKLNLSICNNETVNLYVKIDLSEETKKIYEEMKAKGYNMFNIEDPFYNDICTPYKSDNNTDIILSDRINYIYNNKDSQCQTNCQFSSYLLNSVYINCTCAIVENEEKEETKFSGKKLYESFYDILKYSNYKIMKCYNLIFNKNIFKNNLGNIIILVIFLMYFFCLIAFIIRGTVPLKNKLIIFNQKEFEKNENKEVNIVNIINNNKIEEKINQQILSKNKLFSHPMKKRDNNNILCSIKTNKKPKFKKKTSKINFFHESIKNYFVNNNFNSVIINKISASSKKELEFKEKKEIINKIKLLNTEKKEENKKLDAYELNILEYEEAICYDHRTFLQTYWDLLSREHKIIFTFFICNDYNLLNIKYARFLFLFTNDMAMNVFFFSDESMHKIFLNYGKFNFIQQIPQIVYTTIVSQLIEVFLCFLSLTDKHIYKIKSLSQPYNKTIILRTFRCIKTKLICFFIFIFLFFLLYWYIVSGFCAVYENTQITFLKDSLLSFLLGLLYPFVLYLIPTALRIFSLRHPEWRLKCIYKLSDIIPFF